MLKPFPLLCVAFILLGACAPQAPGIGNGDDVACTMDAKLCPDGSYVGRVPPDCAFAPCPGEVSQTENRLTASPRHQEWIDVPAGDRTIRTWVVYPEVEEKRPAVLVIHENRGLNDWARSMADEIAEAGYIAVAPDLLSGFSETFTRTSDFPDEDAARDALSQLDPAQVTAHLQAVTAWAKALPASTGEIVSAGFCWGGAQAFQLAAETDDLEATLVFYGTGPEDPAAYEQISSPVYGFYGGADERVNATIPDSEQYMTAADNPYDPVLYDGAGHAFMRLGEEPNAEPANAAARSAAWQRMLEILEDVRGDAL